MAHYHDNSCYDFNIQANAENYMPIWQPYPMMTPLQPAPVQPPTTMPVPLNPQLTHYDPMSQYADEEVSYILQHNISPNILHPLSVQQCIASDTSVSYSLPVDRCSSTDTTFSSCSGHTSVSQASTDTGSLGAIEDDGKGGKRQKGELERKKYTRSPKPPYTFAAIIATAIWESPNHMATLKQIQTKMMMYFPFFRGSYRGWKDSVRHSLSHHPCFVKTPNLVNNSKQPQHFKKYIWTIDISQLTAKMFLRRRGSDLNSGDTKQYAIFLHDELNLASPIPLPIGEDYLMCSNKKQKTTKTETLTSPDIIPEQPMSAPYQETTDSTSDHSLANSFYGPITSPIRPVFDPNALPLPSPNFYSPNSLLRQNVCDVMNYIAGTCYRERSSANALGNLSDLCSTKPPTGPSSDKPCDTEGASTPGNELNHDITSDTQQSYPIEELLKSESFGDNNGIMPDEGSTLKWI